MAVAGSAVLVTASAAGLNAGPRPASAPQTGTATASISDKATPSAVCDKFMSHLTTDLGHGLTQTQVNAAIQKAIGETLADEVKAGDIKQAHADAVKQKLTAQPTCALAGIGKNENTGGRAKDTVYRQLLMSAEASALGVSDTKLKADLASGKTISQLAPAGTTEDTFRTKLIAKLTPMLDAAITNKQLTAAQKTQILQRLQTGPVPYWNKSVPHKTVPATGTANS